MTPTAEQAAIVDAARTTSKNIIISAYAGCAKTSTLELICNALPTTPILSLAFNKRIAEEMTKRLPSNVVCKTMNGLGHGIWSKVVTGKIILNTGKSYDLLKAELDKLPKDAKKELNEDFMNILNAVRLAKSSGYIPEGHFYASRSIISRAQFHENLDENLSETALRIIDNVLTEGIALAYKGGIDFDDQIYMTTLFGGTFPVFPLVCVDEAQDLSALNHAMIKKLVAKRLIAVGDSFQSIYGFRGAVGNGMAELKQTFNMEEMKLSCSFRCPREVIKLARSRVPDMTWPDWAPEGKVVYHDDWKVSSIPDGAAIICRNNAPLFKLAINFIKEGRNIKIVGNDLGKGLVKILTGLGERNLPQSKVFEVITSWEQKAKKKAKKISAVDDKVECLKVFAAAGTDLAGAINYAEHIFEQTGQVQLLSGHKAKGLEWDVVYHLDANRIPSKYSETEEDFNQEKNLKYVIETRAKCELHFISTESFVSEQQVKKEEFTYASKPAPFTMRKFNRRY